ncbi:response regulator [Spirulina subsalsa]|uniref:response regulator transcription factor n=1 Tax=Spirulina subsalsa TaxID=54311 RepID=UPI0003655DA2
MKMALIVEDGVTDREFLTRQLQESGLTVMTAGSVEEAQGKLGQSKPDIIFLDVILPGQSGFEFCRFLKSSPDTKQIPVVICSTKGTDVDKTWGTMLGADDYLIKPVDPDALKKTLSRLRF